MSNVVALRRCQVVLNDYGPPETCTNPGLHWWQPTVPDNGQIRIELRPSIVCSEHLDTFLKEWKSEHLSESHETGSPRPRSLRRTVRVRQDLDVP